MTASLTVLLVEDNPPDARLVEEMFHDAKRELDSLFPGMDDAPDDVDVVHESTLTDAVSVVEGAVDLDVVLLDLHLPDSHGIETVETVLSTTRRIPVIVLTGLSDMSQGAEAVSIGAQDYLVKDDVGYEMLVRSISYAIQRKRTERQLRQRTEQLTVMNQLTRHDIRNDITVVLGKSRELRERVDDRYDDDIAEIITASNHVLQLTRTIGDTVEAIATDEDPGLTDVDLERVLTTEIETASSLYENGTVVVEGDVPGIDVRANRLLSSVFGNLLSNAMMYNDAETPTARVTVTVDENTVTVSFADNGPGIPPRQRTALFSEDSPDVEEGGLGIGLYLVQDLVSLYDGAIDVTDNEPRGTVFSVELVRADE